MRQKGESNEQKLGDYSFKPKHGYVPCIHHISKIHASTNCLTWILCDEEEIDAEWKNQIIGNKLSPIESWTYKNQNQFGVQTQKLALTFILSIHKFALMFMCQFTSLVPMFNVHHVKVKHQWK
jgi:hypothetical protein